MKLWCKYKRLILNSIIQILTSPNSYSIESWIYNDIDCQFAICETSFGVRPFSNLKNNTTQIIITVVRVSVTFVLYMQVTIFL
jgi:hypothetical protein